MNKIYLIYEILSKIPKGKIATYRQIACLSGIKNLRLMGKILHKNPDPKTYLCHRVTKGDGSLASGYAFGGAGEQMKKLKFEGIVFQNLKINLKKYLWRLYSQPLTPDS